MPMREEQLERSLRAAAPRVPTVGVVDRVHEKRARRRVIRRAELVALAAILVVTIAAVTVLARDGKEETRVAAPAGSPVARVIDGDPAVLPRGTPSTPVPVTLDPDPGYVRGPLLVTGDTLSLAGYDRSGSTFGFPPSRLVRLDTRSFREDSRTDLRAEILSMTDGEGARWVVTRNQPPADGLPDAFLKRIAADGTVVSTLLPNGSDPVGPVAAGGGSVWIPVRDGVLRIDPSTAQVVDHVSLAPANARSVVVGSDAVWATDGHVVRAVSGDAAGVGSIARGTAVGLVLDGTGAPTPLVVDDATGRAYLGDLAMPNGFSPTRAAAAGPRVVVEGTIGGAPAVVLVDPAHSVRATVILDGGRDASFAWVRPDTLLVVSSGRLLRVDVAP